MSSRGEETAIEPGQSWKVDLMRPEDAKGVARLFLAVYGEGYPIRTYVEPERLKDENARGLTISSVARTPRGDIVGHNALFRSAPHEGIYESGAGLVHPDYRGGKGIFTRLVAHGQEVAAAQFGVEAIYGESVCNHIFSQKMTHSLGWTTHAIEVDLMPASAYVKEKSAAGRVASLLDFKTIVPRPHTVHIPSAFDEQLKFIYQGLDDRREIIPSKGELPANAETKLSVRVFDFAQVARVTVHEAGFDLKSVMDHHEKELKDKGVKVIQVWLDLSWPWTGRAVDILRQNRFFLGGLLPRWFDTDGLLLQKILERPDWDGIRLHFDRARKLLDMVRQDWKEMGEVLVQRDLAEKIRNLPKAELHVHLEGSIGMETLNRLSKRKGQGPLRKNPYVFDRFEAFNEVFLFLSGLLKEEEDFYQVAMDFAARQADENIRYSEASFMPLFHISQGVPVEAVFRGIESGLAEGEERYGARVDLICSIPRIAGPEGGEKTLDLIEQVRSKKIVGIDLAGTEKENDVAPFAGTFERAGDMGLKRVAHAGEFGSSKQISQALDLLGVERIGHGISAIQDSALVHRLAQEGIALEISPTSNLKLKAVASVDAHPVRRLFEMGVPIVINTDDPAFFNTTLCREFQILADRLGFSEEEIEGLIANSFDYSFLEPDERRALRA